MQTIDTFHSTPSNRTAPHREQGAYSANVHSASDARGDDADERPQLDSHGGGECVKTIAQRSAIDTRRRWSVLLLESAVAAGSMGHAARAARWKIRLMPPSQEMTPNDQRSETEVESDTRRHRARLPERLLLARPDAPRPRAFGRSDCRGTPAARRSSLTLPHIRLIRHGAHPASRSCTPAHRADDQRPRPSASSRRAPSA